MTVRMTEAEAAALIEKVRARRAPSAPPAGGKTRKPPAARAKRSAWRRADGSPSEAGEARALADWMRREGITFFRIPNEGVLAGGGGRGAMVNVLKATGMQTDAPDFFLVEHPRIPPELDARGLGHYCGIAIELKATPQGSPPKFPETRPGQLAFLRMLEGKGCLAFVAYGARQAMERLEELGVGRSARNRGVR